MPKQTTNPDILLDEAYRIAEEDGVTALSIRKLAMACGVSAGTVYTYYPSKGDLVAAVINRFFQRAFRKDFCVPDNCEGYVAFCRRLSQTIDSTLAEFRSDWLAQIEALPASERQASHTRETQVMHHMAEQLAKVLLDDADVKVDVGGETGALHLSVFVLDTLVKPRHTQNREALFFLLECALYGTSSEPIGSLSPKEEK